MPPGSAPPGGSNSPIAQRGARGPAVGLGAFGALASRLLGPRSPRQAAPGLGSRVRGRGGGTAAAGPRRRGFGSPGTAAARPIPAAMAPIPVAAAARRFRLSLPHPHHRSPLSPPSRPPAHRTPQPETGSAREPAESPGQRPAPSRPCLPQDPPSIGPWSCQSAPKRRAGCRSACSDWWPRAVHANKAPPTSICTSALV